MNIFQNAFELLQSSQLHLTYYQSNLKKFGIWKIYKSG